MPVNDHFRNSSQIASPNPIVLEQSHIVLRIPDEKLRVAAADDVHVWRGMVVGIDHYSITPNGKQGRHDNPTLRLLQVMGTDHVSRQ